jgi:hypothetical protein
MKRMHKAITQESWLKAIVDAAREQHLALPPFTGGGMGTACSTTVADGRFVTFKRRLVPAAQAEIDGVEWTLWLEKDETPVPIAAFRQPLSPKREEIAATLFFLKGWLFDEWTQDDAKAKVGRHPRCVTI